MIETGPHPKGAERFIVDLLFADGPITPVVIDHLNDDVRLPAKKEEKAKRHIEFFSSLFLILPNKSCYEAAIRKEILLQFLS